MKRVEPKPDWMKGHEDRRCDSCYACCVHLGIEELRKYANAACHHLKGSTDPTKRCSIYAQRPSACRDYKCAWLAGLGPDWMRPSDCGILITIYPSELDPTVVSATITIFDEKKYRQEYLDEIVEQFILLNILELRVINPARKIGLFYSRGDIYKCRLIPTPKGRYEGLMFEVPATPVGHYSRIEQPS